MTYLPYYVLSLIFLLCLTVTAIAQETKPRFIERQTVLEYPDTIEQRRELQREELAEEREELREEAIENRLEVMEQRENELENVRDKWQDRRERINEHIDERQQELRNDQLLDEHNE